MNNQNQICQTCYQRIDASKVEPGAGYRLLTVGEMRTASDEFFQSGRGWRSVRVLYVGTSLRPDSAPTRRKIPVSNHDHATDSGQRACPVCSGEAVVVLEPKVSKVNPGVGYRLLEIGEMIRKSDEAFAEGSWQSFEDEGKIFDGKLFFFPRRRKIEVPPVIEPGEGYRLLAPNEIIEVGDEVWSSFVQEWTAFFPHVAGRQLNPGLTARRKILPDPGAGYRLLKVGEIRQRKDEFFVDGVWRGPTEDVGTPVFQFSWPYRRKISPKYYRLLAVGEMTERTDEVWDYPSVDRPGVWRKLGWRFSVVTDSYSPVRREIDSYIGGPA